MSITLYTAPDCLRCKIVKGFLAEHQIAYETVDFKADAQTFNTFYRANRKAIYRNPEGVEFPLFDDGTVIKQGSGEVIAYLLSGHALEGAVTRSDLLHGWISGLYLSQCPAAEEDHFVELVQQLAKGGLTVCIQTDGRNPALLERLIGLNALAKVAQHPRPSIRLRSPLRFRAHQGRTRQDHRTGESVPRPRNPFPRHPALRSRGRPLAEPRRSR